MVDLKVLDFVLRGQILCFPAMRILSAASVDWIHTFPPVEISLGKGMGSVMFLGR